MEWVTLDVASVTAHLPTDLAAQYESWLAANPDKAGRLAEITANTVAEFRDNIRSNPVNTLDPDTSKIPQSATRHAESIIFFQLAMEMGLDIDTEGTQSMTRADMFLRQISYQHFKTQGGEATLPSPHYTVPERKEIPGRALSALALLLVLFAMPAHAGWIANKKVTDDTAVTVTYAPQHYTNTTTQVYGHLQGIDRALAALIPFITNSVGSGAYLSIAGGNLNGDLGLQGHAIHSVYAISFSDALIPAGPTTPELRQFQSNLTFRGRTVADNGTLPTLYFYFGATNFTPTNASLRGVFSGIDHAMGDLQPSAIAGPGLGIITNAQGLVQLTVTNAP